MSWITKNLFKCLSDIQPYGQYYASGTIEAFPPILEVDGIGRIAFPLVPKQAEQLIAAAKRAPYGKGHDTVVDIKIRRTWQIDAELITLGGKHWSTLLDTIVAQAANDLGVAPGVRAELYKLLIYDTGSFFVSHRDTEKTAGMFGTLVIALPSLFRGGELRISHHQQEVLLDLHREEPSEIAFAAFYADCRHEVLPVTEGYRLTLIFNLVRPNTKTALSPQPVDFRRKINQSALLLKNWTASLAKDSTSKLPNKLIVPLEHAYTDAEIGFYNLKNADAALAKILNQAAREADCEIVLASVNMSQTAKWFVSRSLWGDNDGGHRVAGEWIIPEVHEPNYWISVKPDFWDWDDSHFPDLSYSADEFCPPEAFEQIETCEFEYYEVKGNEAASLERQYHSAAFIIWPRAARLTIFHKEGIEAVLWELSNLLKLWEHEGKPHHSPHRRNAQMAASLILRDWLPYASAQSRWLLNRFADLLLDLEDSEHIDQLWSMIVEKGFYFREDYKWWLEMSERLPEATVVQRLESAIKSIGRKAPRAAAEVLAAFCRSRPDLAPSLKKAAEALYSALPGDPEHFKQLPSLEDVDRSITPQAVADILECFHAIEPSLVDQALSHMLNWPDCYDIEKILTPAFLQLTSQPLPVVTELRALIKSHLQRRSSRGVGEETAD